MTRIRPWLVLAPLFVLDVAMFVSWS